MAHSIVSYTIYFGLSAAQNSTLSDSKMIIADTVRILHLCRYMTSERYPTIRKNFCNSRKPEIILNLFIFSQNESEVQNTLYNKYFFLVVANTPSKLQLCKSLVNNY